MSTRRFQCSLAGLIWLTTVLVGLGSEKPLRYGFEKGQTYGYDIKITWTYPDYEETLKGFTLITVGRVQDNRVDLTQEKHLVKRKSTQAAAPAESLSGIELPREYINIDRRGKDVRSITLKPLKEIMEYQETIMLPVLPEGNEKQWHIDERISIGSSRSDLPERIVIGNETAKDRADYKWSRTEGDLVWIDSTRRIFTQKHTVTNKLTNETKVFGPSFDLTANGRYAFDRRRGVVTTLSTIYKIISKRGEKNWTVRAKVECRLLEPAEVADIRKALVPKRPSRADRKRVLQALRSDDSRKRMEGLELACTFARDDRPEDFAVPLAKFLKSRAMHARLLAAKALAIWATPTVEADLIAALRKAGEHEDIEMIRALGTVGTENAAEAIILRAPDHRGIISAALIAIGPAAEKAAIKLLSYQSHQAKEAGCRALAKIGGPDGAVALQKMIQSSRISSTRDKAYAALTAIRERVPASAIKEVAQKSEPLSDGMRIWTDVTGKFKTKAKLLGIQGQNVVLKKEDGKRITVPAAKLSKADLIFLKSKLSSR